MTNGSGMQDYWPCESQEEFEENPDESAAIETGVSFERFDSFTTRQSYVSYPFFQH